MKLGSHKTNLCGEKEVKAIRTGEASGTQCIWQALKYHQEEPSVVCTVGCQIIEALTASRCWMLLAGRNSSRRTSYTSLALALDILLQDLEQGDAPNAVVSTLHQSRAKHPISSHNTAQMQNRGRERYIQIQQFMQPW